MAGNVPLLAACWKWTSGKHLTLFNGFFYKTFFYSLDFQAGLFLFSCNVSPLSHTLLLWMVIFIGSFWAKMAFDRGILCPHTTSFVVWNTYPEC
jgi:hypothetical protein